MTFAPALNHPSIQWILDRVKEGTPATAARGMMREEGYAMDNSLFNAIYHAIERVAMLRQSAEARRWRQKRRLK